MQAEASQRVKKKRGQRGRGKAVRFDMCSGFRALPERARQNGGVVMELVPIAPNNPGTFKRDCAYAECMLDAYQRRGDIDETQWKVGVRVRQSWQIVRGVQTKDSLLCEIIDGSSQGNVGEVKSRAVKDIDAVFRKLSEKQCKIVIGICVNDDTAGSKERMNAFRRGLDLLAKEFGL